MTTRKFVKRTIILLCVFIIVTFTLSTASYTVSTIISNNLAVNQLQQDDSAFVLMELYNNALKPIIPLIYYVVCVAVLATFATNIYKFYKYKKMEKIKNEENNRI